MTKKQWIATIIGLVALAAAAILLVLAFRYPFVSSTFHIELPNWIPRFGGIRENIQKWIIQNGGIVIGPQYLRVMIQGLFDQGETVLGLLVVGFSVVFPSLKIAATGILFIGQKWISAVWRLRLADWLGFLAKWSMGDIFIVALVVVLVKAEGFNYVFTAEKGVYCYAASAIMASIAASLVRFTVPGTPPGRQLSA